MRLLTDEECRDLNTAVELTRLLASVGAEPLRPLYAAMAARLTPERDRATKRRADANRPDRRRPR